MSRNRGRVSAAASFFGFHARGRQRAEDRRDEREPEGRRSAAPEHGDDGVPADEQFGARSDRAEDDDYMQYDDPHEDEGMPESRRRARRARRAEEDGYNRYEDEDDSGDREGRRADAQDGDPDEEDEVEQDREGRRARRSARRARADDGDGDEDDDEAEMRGRSAAAAARRRERARCEAILTSRQAAANPELAASLAFETTMTRQQALRTLARAPAPAASGRADRNPRIGAGGERTRSGTETIQSGWGHAFAKAGVTKPEAENGWGRAVAGQR